MAFLDVHFYSKALDVQVSVYVLLPENEGGIGISSAAGKEAPRVLYLLHGYSDDHTIWLRRTSIDRYAADKNLAVVMPAVNHSFYTNEAHGEKYWDFVSEELPQAIQRFFRVSDRPRDTFVCGLSMGGYGAMKLALTHPDRFRAAGSFSGALDIAAPERMTKDRKERYERIFGDVRTLQGSAHDLHHLLEKNASAPEKPRLYIACGDKDFLYSQHGPFIKKAEALGWDVTHREVPDFGHEWAFWDQQIQAFLAWALPED